MHYSINDLVSYVKANWKHLLAGFVSAYIAQHFGVAGTGQVAAILKVIGLG